jgi:hypothetical protein
VLSPEEQIVFSFFPNNVTISSGSKKFDVEVYVPNTAFTVLVLTHVQVVELALLKENKLLQLQELLVIPAWSVGESKTMSTYPPLSLKVAELIFGAGDRADDEIISTLTVSK